MNNKTTESFPCLVFVFCYDAKNQLVRHDSVTQNASFKYEYDKAGNITAWKRYAYTTGSLGTALETRNYTYDAGSWGDLLTNWNGQTITYDGMGNMTSFSGRTYSWNGRELSGISGGGNTYSYKYNAAGFRTSKTVNGTTTEYFLNGSQLLAQKTGDTLLWFFYDSEGRRIGLISGGLIFYYLYNAQGDVVAIVRAATGEIVARYSYDAWGNCTVTNADGYITGTKNPFRYRGYYYDAESGLYYLGSRYYDPELGRFISPDVFISTGQGLLGANMFAYCGNNPVNCADPNGMLINQFVNVADGGGKKKSIEDEIAEKKSLGNIQALGAGDYVPYEAVKGVDGIGASFTAAWGLAAEVQALIIWDAYGDYSLLLSFGLGGGLGKSGGVSFYSNPNVDHVGDLNGSGVSIGGTALFLGIEVSSSKGNDTGTSYVTWFKSGFEFHSVITRTFIIPFGAGE